MPIVDIPIEINLVKGYGSLKHNGKWYGIVEGSFYYPLGREDQDKALSDAKQMYDILHNPIVKDPLE